MKRLKLFKMLNNNGNLVKSSEPAIILDSNNELFFVGSLTRADEIYVEELTKKTVSELTLIELPLDQNEINKAIAKPNYALELYQIVQAYYRRKCED